MRSSARSITVGGGLGLALAAAGGALAGRSLERRWRAHHDPIGPDGLTLPVSERIVVQTDDGAQLVVVVCEPARATAPTVVMAHGWTNTHQIWAPVARRLLDAGHRVVLYDQRGHGASSFGDGHQPHAPARPPAASTSTAATDASAALVAAGLTVPRFGADLATVLEQLDVHDVILAGHSMGGFSVLAFACDHGQVLQERVRGVVLVSTAAHGLGAGSMTPLVTRVLGSKVPGLVMGRPRAGVILLRRVVGRQPRYTHVSVARDMFVATPPHVTAACYACFAEMDLRTRLGAVNTPSVVMVGTHDLLTPVVLSRAVVASLPNARLELLDDAGHMLPLETPNQVAEAISSLAA